MISKVRPLVAERDGIDLDVSEEIVQAEDMVQCHGLAFDGDLTHVIERIAGIIKCTIPDFSTKSTYSGDDDITAYEIFNTNTQVVANRLVRGDFSYTDDNLTGEVWKIYDTADGTTILRTITITHNYSGDDLTGSEVSES